ncbi:MAG: hypothetical protein CMM12_01590 [Rhodospirillaceae bacterium]|jgi:cytochrome b pre-mRNA-processing protein 3|nr:hypothetical protein [Rhodospirillaceae bacterium]
MSLQSMFGRSKTQVAVDRIYQIAVDQARTSDLYEKYGVPDTVDGRFEMVTLHIFLVLRRLKGAKSPGRDISQALFDYMFEDMDLSLREMGAGDMGVGKRVKAMVQAFYGRVASYEEGLAAKGDVLAKAIERNVFGTVDAPGCAAARLAEYVRIQDQALSDIPREQIEQAAFNYGPMT